MAHAHKKKRAHVVPANAQQFIREHLSDAQAVSRQYNVPVSLVLAQSALETGWGSRVVGNAYFGVKGKSSSGNTVAFTTHEQDKAGNASKIVGNFRAFESYREAAEDWASLLTRKYPEVMRHRSSGIDMAKNMKRYATAVNYAPKLVEMFHTGNLTQYDVQTTSK